MLAELAAANAAFGVIKSFVSNGKELASCGKQISDFVFAKEKIEKEVNKHKAKGVTGGDLEEFMALEELRQKEEELKQIMIYVGRPGLWADWQKFQAQARKARRAKAHFRPTVGGTNSKAGRALWLLGRTSQRGIGAIPKGSHKRFGNELCANPIGRSQTHSRSRGQKTYREYHSAYWYRRGGGKLCFCV